MTTSQPYTVQMLALLCDESLVALLRDATMQAPAIEQLKAEQQRRGTR